GSVQVHRWRYARVVEPVRATHLVAAGVLCWCSPVMPSSAPMVASTGLPSPRWEWRTGRDSPQRLRSADVVVLGGDTVHGDRAAHRVGDEAALVAPVVQGGDLGVGGCGSRPLDGRAQVDIGDPRDTVLVAPHGTLRIVAV